MLANCLLVDHFGVIKNKLLLCSRNPRNIQEILPKTTVYEHPRTMILFEGPCDLAISRDGEKLIVCGVESKQQLP